MNEYQHFWQWVTSPNCENMFMFCLFLFCCCCCFFFFFFSEIWLKIDTQCTMSIVENARVRRWFLQLQEILHWKLWNLFKVIIIHVTHWPHTETVKTLWWHINYNFQKFYTKKKYCFKINNAGLCNCIELKTLFKIINFDHNFWPELSKNIHFQHLKKSLTKN